MSMDVIYELEILKMLAFDNKGKAVTEKEVQTARNSYKLVLDTDGQFIKADGKDLAIVTVSVVDKNSNPCPTATNQLQFKVNVYGYYRAACNGDAT